MENKKIPTAEEFVVKYNSTAQEDSLMVAFAKLHVEAALKAASENAKINVSEGNKEVFIGWGAGRTPAYAKETIREVSEDSIINSYPLENIK